MGKGDKKTKRGKIISGSYGKSRMRKESTPLHSESADSKEKSENAPKDTAKKAATPKAKAAPKKADEGKETAVKKKATEKTPEPNAEKGESKVQVEAKVKPERSDKEVNAEISERNEHRTT